MRAFRVSCLLLVGVTGAWGGVLPHAVPGLALAASVPAPSVDAAAMAAGTETASLRFTPGSVALPADAPTVLDKLASRLTADRNRRIELLAYATSRTDASDARRLSLDRAVAVRAYLTAQGVAPVRVILRPLGERAPVGTPADRVDMVALD
jgi:outer membrane protein OmpA-like peptidoglycan-associated protein